MNDKCAAGTGRFLEIMANLLGLTPDGLCRLAAEGGGTVISSLCTVFAQSEVTSLIGQGTSKADIAFAVVESIVTKVTAQIRKLRQNTGSVCLTGGLCQCTYLCQRLSHALEQEVVTSPDGRYAGAIGAALEASVCIQ